MFIKTYVFYDFVPHTCFLWIFICGNFNGCLKCALQERICFLSVGWLHSKTINLYHLNFSLKSIYLVVLGLSCTKWKLVTWPGIKPRAPVLGSWSLSHWTMGRVPCLKVFNMGFWRTTSSGNFSPTLHQRGFVVNIRPLFAPTQSQD